MIFCKECRSLSKEEGTVLRSYVDPAYAHQLDDCKHPSHYMMSSAWRSIKSRICMHKACFEEVVHVTPMERTVSTIRKKGQAQLNKHNNCALFSTKDAPEPPTPPSTRTIVEGVDPRKTNSGEVKSPWYKFW